ncbi:MAG: hypothetical protein VYC50_05350 [Pseudomonadota bacterium]|nr:hypothetical protein [Pseudomonadota bacterium]|tara:strand:+ start:1103 stop:1525 length:423 start_codon:yes stop_codon:yes gene_type:complete
MTKKVQLIVHNLERAVKVLLGDDSIKDRLYEAYSSYIAELDLSILDDVINEKINHLHEMMHKQRAVSGNDHILATVQKMSTIEASIYSREIFSIYSLIIFNQLDEEKSVNKSRGPLKAAKSKNIKSNNKNSIPQFLKKSN